MPGYEKIAATVRTISAFSNFSRSIQTLLWPAMLALTLGSAGASAEESSDTLTKIKKTGTVTIGHRVSEPPFSYLVAGAPTGYAVEICQRIVKDIAATLGKSDLRIEYVSVTSATRFVMVKSRRIDMECAATTNNAERRKMVAFSYPHFVTATRFVSLKTSNIRSISDLTGRSVAATTGTVNLDQLNAINRQRMLNISVLLNRENSDSFNLVTSGKASAFVMDDILLAGQIAASSKPEDYVISEETFSPPEPYGILLPLGDDAFKAVVNASLEKLFTSKDIQELYTKWFERPIPPLGQNMKLPMSPELKAVFSKPKEYLE